MSDMKTYAGAVHGLCVASQVLKKSTVQTAVTGGRTFAGCLSLCRSVTKTTTVVTRTVTVSTAAMTMEEYKEYLAEKLDAIPWHPSRFHDEEAITISDAGWQRLKNDPEYEKEVLDGIAADRAFYSPLFGLCPGGSYCTRYIGVTREEYQGWSWSKQYGFGSAEASRSAFEEKAKNSFWKSRERRRAQYAIDEARCRERRHATQLGQQKAWQVRLEARGEAVPLPLGSSPAAALAMMI